MVASEREWIVLWRGLLVSIPFIAGQWSLQAYNEALADVETHVSIPFIAGQWSLHKNNKNKEEEKK